MRLSPDRLARPFVVFVERFYPDAFVFAIVLSLVTFGMAVGMTPTTAGEAIGVWGRGLTGLLPFITQVALTLVCAHALAHTDLVRRGVEGVAGWPRTGPQAYALVALVSSAASLVAWSLGLVVGALVALAVARAGGERGLRFHFPLLVASAYAGFSVWHMGYSSSAALFVATPGHALETATGVVPVSATIFSGWNLAVVFVAVLVIAGLCSTLGPAEEGLVTLEEDPAPDAPASEDESPRSFGERVESARVLSVLMSLVFFAYLGSWFLERGLQLTLDIVNWSFLAFGLLLARSPIHYVELIREASRSLGPIILQYPFYAGIMGLMTGTELVGIFSDLFVALASAETLGFWAFVAGGVLNFFVPSGGGQWAVQGPIFIEAAQQLGVRVPVVVMGVAYGDQWSNLIQPFWTLPLLAIAGLNARAIMGYCFVIFVALFFVFGGGLLLVGSG